MLAKIINYGGITSIVGGVILAIGTVGASDLELIDLNTLIIRGAISILIVLIGYLVLKIGGYSIDTRE